MLEEMPTRNQLVCPADFFVVKPFAGYFLRPVSKFFSQSFSSQTVCSSLDISFTAKDLCVFWLSKYDQVNTDIFHSWENTLT